MPDSRTDTSAVSLSFFEYSLLYPGLGCRLFFEFDLTECRLGCDTAINPPTQHVGDADCRMVCQATHTEFCGNQNRVAIYQYSASGVPPGHQACLNTSLGNYTIMAEYKDPPTGGPTSVPLKIVTVELVKDVLWTVLSVSPRSPFETVAESDPTYHLGLSTMWIRMDKTESAEQHHQSPFGCPN